MSGAFGGLFIGGVQLSDFEIPDRMRWGTKQALKEFTYPGGQNQIQAMGPNRKPLRWSGQMISPDATDRARILDGFASQGAVVEVAWGDLNFDAVVEDFEADYKHQWQGGYTIECRVLWDYDIQPAQPDPETATANDLGSAGDSLSSFLSPVTDAINTVGNVVSSAENAVSGVVGAVTGAVGALTSALSSVTGIALNIPVPGALFAAQGLIQGSLSAIGNAASLAGNILDDAALIPQNVLRLTAAAGASAACAVSFGFGARAAQSWSQVPGISTPSDGAQPVQPDLSQYAGA